MNSFPVDPLEIRPVPFDCLRLIASVDNAQVLLNSSVNRDVYGVM